jgi:Flp pilus assembly protein TadB
MSKVYVILAVAIAIVLAFFAGRWTTTTHQQEKCVALSEEMTETMSIVNSSVKGISDFILKEAASKK